MPSFRKPKAQAEKAISKMLEIGTDRHTNKHDNKIHSLGTLRNMKQALERVTEWIQQNRLGDLRSLTQELAIQFLQYRKTTVGQKMLDQERQAIQKYLKVKLPVIKAEIIHAKTARAYTQKQVALIARAQTEKNKLATKIAYAAGLRAHELLTLRKLEKRTASSHRTWSQSRFIGRVGEVYTVAGKGGLIREVLIPKYLAEELESKTLEKPIMVKDRDIYYKKYYDINGGVTWSSSFSSASNRVLTWSTGAHGLRHAYAQERMHELLKLGYVREDALSIISQEMGHFRSGITEVYLR